MRNVDEQAITDHWPTWASRVGHVARVSILSPSAFELELSHRLFPGSLKTQLARARWDLDTGRFTGNMDVIIACNVFMYSQDPQLWFDNVRKSCRYLFLQDHVESWRGPNELGSDGDSMRYQLAPSVIAPFSGAYDLGALGTDLLEFVTYPYTAEQGNGSGKPATSFVALIAGDMT